MHPGAAPPAIGVAQGGYSLSGPGPATASVPPDTGARPGARGSLHGTAPAPAAAPPIPAAPAPAHVPPAASHPPRRPTLLPEAEPRPGVSPWILVAVLVLLLAAIIGSAFWLKGERAKPEGSRTGARESGNATGEREGEKANPPAESGGEAGTEQANANPTSAAPARVPALENAGATPAAATPAAETPAAARPPAETSAPAASPATRNPRPAPARPAVASESRREPTASGAPGDGVDQNGDYVIHAASFIGDPAKISEVRREYEGKLGVPVAIVRVGMTGDPWWNRVYLGPFATQAAAQEAQAALAQRGLLDPEAAVLRLSANRTRQ
jgi:hypothetical protein